MSFLNFFNKKSATVAAEDVARIADASERVATAAETTAAAAQQVADSVSRLSALDALNTAATATVPGAAVEWTAELTQTSEGGISLRPAGQTIHIPALEAKKYEGQPLANLVRDYAARAGVSDPSVLTSYLLNGRPVQATELVPTVPETGTPVRVAAAAPAGRLG